MNDGDGAIARAWRLERRILQDVVLRNGYPWGMEHVLVEEIFDSLQELGQLHSRKMFGGVGLYCDEIFFGLLAWDILFFKVDDETRDAYLARKARPFLPGLEHPTDEATQKASYYEVPLEVQEQRGDFLLWARAALGAAKRKKAKKPRSKTQRKPRDPGKRPLRQLRNLGPVSSAWLKSVGIVTRADLEVLGSVKAYARVLDAGVKPNLNLLYAMEGALMDLDILRLPSVVKSSLRERFASLTRRKKA